ncbi:MAG: prolyl oligopeptidase family serine peptidase [Acidobacteriota bacterium]
MWAVVLVLFGTTSMVAQQRIYEESFLLPPQAVQDILNRDRNYDTLNLLSPDGDHFVIPLRDEFSSHQLMARKTYRLAMLEIVPAANREWRLSTYGTRGLKIYSLAARRSWEVQFPEHLFISDMTWSPKGEKIAFLAHLEKGTQVWVADVASGRSQALSDAFVLATLAGRPQRGRGVIRPSRLLQWTPEGSILTLLVPTDRGPEPQEPALPVSPIIRHTRKKPTPTRTYPFLLKTPHDQELFRYYTTAQLALLEPGHPPRNIGQPAMYLEFSLSPDGKHVLSEKLVDPLSYIASYSGFPRRLEVMDLSGKVLSTVREIPLQEAFLRGGAKGPREDLPREVAWRPDSRGLTFQWRAEKEKGGEEDKSRASAREDRLMLLAPPFDLSQVKTLVSSKKSFSHVSYSRAGRFAFATLSGKGEDGQKSRNEIVAYDLTQEPPVRHVLAKEIDPGDLLNLPGEILTARTGNGTLYARLSSDKEAAYLRGRGYREDFRPRPFIDRVQISSGNKERIFEGSSEMYENPLVVLDDDLNRIVFSRQSKTDFPDSYLWQKDRSSVRLTDNHDPFPEVAGCQRIDFEFTRRDGLTIQGRLSLPVDYRAGTRVPAVFWTYPREFKSFKEYKKAAIRSRNHNRFPHLNYRNASEIWLTQGYAVVEPDIPIIGKGNTFNNNYISHLRDSMYAAIRKLDEMGYVDVDRLGHGGHSYGAFATANVLAHTPFFKAGIAGDGAYNRTLTPMSFQSEKRFLWEAQDTILEMSPFFYADHLDTPLLMYHGAADNNTGTFLIQSERMMQALSGLGKTAVLYIYPFESHGPRTKETYLDLWARWLEWFDTYVKGASAEPVAPTGEVSSAKERY